MEAVLSFILVIGVLIVVHEAGHFLVARKFGVKIEKFSIGFGPKIFSRTVGETEYRVAWIPLGGYVKMLGENDPEMNNRLSIRSRTPPCPGMMPPESLTPAARLNADSERSPI